MRELLVMLLILVVSFPFRAWCRLRDRHYWQIDAYGEGWHCERCGERWKFSTNDVKRMAG